MRQKDDRAKAAVAHHLVEVVLKEAVDPDVDLRAEPHLDQHRNRVGQSGDDQGDEDLALGRLGREKSPGEKEGQDRDRLRCDRGDESWMRRPGMAVKVK